MVLYCVDAASVEENAGEARGENLNTLKRLRVSADKREERVKVHVELISTQVHLVLCIRCTINIADLKRLIIVLVIICLAEDGNYIILRLACTVLAQKAKSDRDRGLGHSILPVALGSSALNFYIFQFYLLQKTGWQPRPLCDLEHLFKNTLSNFGFQQIISSSFFDEDI